MWEFKSIQQIHENIFFVALSQKKALAIASAFFSEIRSSGTSEISSMWNICFANVKYACGIWRNEFYFTWCAASIFTIPSGRGIVSPRAGERFYFSLLIQQPPETSKIFGGSFIFSCVYSFYRVYSLYLSAMLLPMSTPMTDAIIRPLVQPLESPRQWRPLTFVSKFSSILMRLE